MTEALPGDAPERFDAEAAWISWLGGRPITTITARLGDLRALGRFLFAKRTTSDTGAMADERNTALCLLQLGHARCYAILQGWATAQLSRGDHPASVARRLSTAASWIGHCSELGLGWRVHLQRPPVARYQGKRCIAWADVERVIGTLQREGQAYALAAILTLADHGLRRAEACALRLETIDPQRGIEVRRKGGERRRVQLSRRAHAAIIAIADGRTEGPALLTPRWRPHTPTTLARLVWQLGLVAPHQIRHAGARELYERTHDAALIREWLGHERIATTEIYVQSLADGARIATALLAREGDENARPE